MNQDHTYYVAEAYDNSQYTAGIVRKDNEKLLDANGFTPLKFRRTREGSAFIKISRIINAVQLAFSIKPNSLVLFHFPLLAAAYKWLLQLLKWRGIKTVALVIDIDGIRDNDEQLLQDELRLLHQFSYIIGHNPAMKNKLLEYIPAAKVFSIGLFDYPVKGQPLQRVFSCIICYAGNITKATFVYQLHQVQQCHFYIYGVGYNAAMNPKNSFIYKAVVAPDVLPSVLEGSFGLVWDGDSVDSCDEYLRYNNPHKLSLYLAAGLPVIVWKQSAVAAFVEENNIGITLDSLIEIPVKLGSMTADDYEKMRTQVLAIGQQIKEGYFLKKVITEIKAL
ncbi:MAG: hypothetical protein IPP72_20325 [Chitinophagaceae bacterium]|nr:hypothetical protein [Chitinophagaceae bacterium]